MAQAAPRASVSWTLAGNVAYAASQWACLALVAKLGDATMVGRFALGLAIVGPVMLFAGLQLRAVQATDASGRFTFAQYLGLRTLTTVLALLACGLGDAVVLAIAISKAGEGLSDICYGAFQHRERMDLIAKSMVLRGALWLALIALALPHGLLPALTAMALASWLVALLLDLPQARRHVGSLRPNFDVGALARLALPLGLVYLLTALTTNVPRYFLAHQVGTAAVGIFAALAYLILVGGTLVNALGQSAAPRLSRLHAAGRRRDFRIELAKLVSAGFAIGIAGVAVALAAGPLVLTLAYRPEYAEHATVLAWLMAAGGLGFVGSLLGYGMTATGAFKAQVPLTLAVLATTALGCALWVPPLGLVGAALAMLAGAAVQCAGGAWVLYRAG